MKRKVTESQREKLLLNQNVKTVTNVGIIYTQEFRQKALELYAQGKAANDIFIEAGFDIHELGFENPVKNLSKWRLNSGVKASKNIISKNIKSNTEPMTIKNALARIKYLEAENEFLKKLEALENQHR